MDIHSLSFILDEPTFPTSSDSSCVTRVNHREAYVNHWRLHDSEIMMQVHFPSSTVVIYLRGHIRNGVRTRTPVVDTLHFPLSELVIQVND